jgi:hypothetical protein
MLNLRVGRIFIIVCQLTRVLIVNFDNLTDTVLRW